MRTKLSASAAAIVAALAALAPRPALAGPTEDAKVLFNVGAQAYEKSDFLAAVQAFEQAYRLAPRPGILFSIAQAHRKQYYTGGRQVAELRAAIAGYREYLAKVEQGGRRSDAAEALVELEAIAAKVDPGAPATAVAAPPPAQAATRVMITSQTGDAMISLDGAKPHETPLVTEVTPGRHSLRVSAPGYFDEARDVDVTAGTTFPLDLPLREKPAKVSIRAPPGAQVSIDGRMAAQTPLSQPLDVEPGKHLVAVTKNGYRAYGVEIDVGRNEARSIDVRLDATVQRAASYGVMAAGGAGVLAGGVLAGFALYHAQQAQSFNDQRTQGKLSCSTTDACSTLFNGYSDQVAARDSFRLAAGVAIGAGVVVGAVGLMLFAFDQPTTSAARRDEGPKPAAPPPRDRPMDLSAAPLLGPGLYGAALSGRF